MNSARPLLKRRVLEWDLWGRGRWMKGEEHAGLVHIRGVGAAAVEEGGVFLRVHGRPWWPVPADKAVRARPKELILLHREGETVCLYPEDGADEFYQKTERRLTSSDIDRLESDTIELAMADNKTYGGPAEQLTGALVTVLKLSGVVFCIIWLGVASAGYFV